MQDPVTNSLNMVGTCIALAERPEHVTTWTNQEPVDFTADFALLKTEYAAVTAAAATAYAATTGPADAKAAAETALENAAHVLARACAAHFAKTGDLTRRAQVNLTKSAIQRLRDVELVNKATLIRNTATAASGETGAGARGVTAGRIGTLTAAIGAFGALLNAPRGQIVNRTALIRDVETRTAGLVARVEALDDLALQFDGTPEGRAFAAGWKQARIIVDAGHGPGEDDAPPAPGGGTPPPAGGGTP